MRVVTTNVLPLRAEPRRDAGQVSQQWLGGRVRILEAANGWAYVECDDTYRGWAEARLLGPVADAPTITVTSAFAEFRERPDRVSPLILRAPLLATVAGAERSRFGVSADYECCVLPGGTPAYVSGDCLVALLLPAPSDIAAGAARSGREFLGTPYLWGGSTPFGLDCSGFAQLCYRLAGVVLRRDSFMQRQDSRFAPAPLEALEPGDLIFFGDGSERITHVALALDSRSFIHSSGGVGVTISVVGDPADRYWPRRVDARRLDPTRAGDPVVPLEANPS